MTYRFLTLLIFILLVLTSCEINEMAAEVSAGEDMIDFSEETLPADTEVFPLDFQELGTEVITAASSGTEVLEEKPEAVTEAVSEVWKPNDGHINAFETPADKPELSAFALEREDEPEPVDYEAIQPNEAGEIPIIMYHGIDAESPGRYDRKTSDFIKDLQALYDGGFRLVSLTDALSGNINVPAGFSPAVLTFDDGKKSSFSLQEKDGELVPENGCAVDVIERFAGEHPGFGTAAAFFLIGCDEPFRGSQGTVAERLTYLTENGYEIGNHTYSHSSLGKMSGVQVQDEIGFTDELFLSVMPGITLNTVAYPGGASPQEGLLGYILNGEYNGREYHYSWGLRCAPVGTSSNPFNVNFDPVNVPRLRPTDDSTKEYNVTDLWYFLRKYEKEPWLKFISDGRPETVAVHSEWKDKVNLDALDGRELVVWGE